MLNQLLYIPRSAADGYVFSGSWATVLMSSLKDIGIEVQSFRKDEKHRADFVTIANANGATQTIKLNANASMNVVKFKSLIRIATGAYRLDDLAPGQCRIIDAHRAPSPTSRGRAGRGFQRGAER